MKISLFTVLLLFAGFTVVPVLGCTCVSLDAPKDDPIKVRENLRRYYLNEFHGALFIGKVTASDVMWDSKEETKIRKVIVDVEKFWLGVDSPEVTVYTWPGDGADCGYPFEVGKEYFFNPQYIDGVLKTGACSYANGFPKDPEVSAAKLEEILGKPKTFPKPKN